MAQPYVTLFCPSHLLEFAIMRRYSFPETEKTDWFTFDADEFIQQSKVCTWLINHVFAILSAHGSDGSTSFMHNAMKECRVKPGKFYRCTLTVEHVIR